MASERIQAAQHLVENLAGSGGGFDRGVGAQRIYVDAAGAILSAAAPIRSVAVMRRFAHRHWKTCFACWTVFFTIGIATLIEWAGYVSPVMDALRFCVRCFWEGWI